ncbi:MAG: cob(I)yrinic acid a,c-diamide adenosyltransferase [Fusobacteriaceae bacterium]|nr:cob(I)yrinic acid a,c-diamide adenosyltransferase [Fusobacteriaceae bacterium]
MNTGLVHFYIGNGKGKSTSLFGLALRALGRNFKVLIVQVLKVEDTGEILFLKNQKINNLEIVQIISYDKFTWEMSISEIENTKFIISHGIQNVFNIYNNYDIVFFDELLNAELLGFISSNTIIDLISNKKSQVELIFSGRDVSENLKEYADYISVIKCEKHPYNLGISGRIGIEF